jgi:hypothetical protein
VEGLGEVVVGAIVEAGDLVIKGVSGRDNDNAVFLFVLSQIFEQPEAAAAGEIYIENDTVIGSIFYPLQGLGVVADTLANELLLPEIAGDAVEQAGFIFNDE